LLKLVADTSIDEPQLMAARNPACVRQNWGETTHWKHFLEKLVRLTVRDLPQST
jgi:hypothetical protein